MRQHAPTAQREIGQVAPNKMIIEKAPRIMRPVPVGTYRCRMLTISVNWTSHQSCNATHRDDAGRPRPNRHRLRSGSSPQRDAEVLARLECRSSHRTTPFKMPRFHRTLRKSGTTGTMLLCNWQKGFSSETVGRISWDGTSGAGFSITTPLLNCSSARIK